MSSISGFVIDRRVPCDELRRGGFFSDVTIKIGNRTFPCHRILLAAATEYFRTMFIQEFIEAQQEVIELKDVDADDFELLLRHIYGGSVSLDKGDNAHRLLRICHYLHPEGLEDLCTHYRTNIDEIPVNTVGRIYKFASETGELTFAISLAEYIAKKFPAIDRSDDNAMLELSGSELLTVFEQPDFSVSSVDTFDFLARWATFQSSENRESLPALMRSVRLQDIPQEKFVKIMADNLGTSNIGPLSLEAHGDESKKSVIESNLERNGESPCPENVMKLPFILFSTDCRAPEYYVNKYRAENLSHLFLLDSILFGSDVSDLKAIFVCGVQYIVVNSFCTGTVNLTPFAYSGCARTKLRYQSLKVVNGRSTSQVAASEMEIYAYTGDMSSYRCELDSWYCVQECFPVQVDKCNMLSYDHSLYLIGGVSGNPTSSEDEGKYFQHYDTREGKGALLTPMKYTHINPASCVYNDVLYVSGGENLSYYTGPIECFDFKAGKWDVFESSLPWPSFGQNMIAYDKKLWFFGGWNYGADLRNYSNKSNLTWFYYDMLQHKWSENTSLPTKIRNFNIKEILDVVVEI